MGSTFNRNGKWSTSKSNKIFTSRNQKMAELGFTPKLSVKSDMLSCSTQAGWHLVPGPWTLWSHDIMPRWFFFFFFKYSLRVLGMKNRRLDPICVCFSIRKLTSLLVLSVCHLHLRGVLSHVPLFPINWSQISYSWHLVTFRFDYFSSGVGASLFIGSWVFLNTYSI